MARQLCCNMESTGGRKDGCRPRLYGDKGRSFGVSRTYYRRKLPVLPIPRLSHNFQEGLVRVEDRSET